MTQTTKADPDGVDAILNEVMSAKWQKAARESPGQFKECETLYFDLETVPDWEQAHRIGIEPLPESPPETAEEDLEAPGDMLDCSVKTFIQKLTDIVPCEEYLHELISHEQIGKKPREGIFDAIRRAMDHGNRYEAERDDQRKRLATCPELCKIVALSVGLDANVYSFVVGDGEDGEPGQIAITEEDLLRIFWNSALNAKQICGYNIINFDLPVVFARSILLGIPSTRRFSTKPWEDEVLDLYLRRFPRGNSKQPGKLKQMAQLYGIDVPAGDFEGSQVEEIWNAGDYEMIREYVTSDVVITAALHKCMRGYFV